MEHYGFPPPLAADSFVDPASSTEAPYREIAHNNKAEMPIRFLMIVDCVGGFSGRPTKSLKNKLELE